jgi:protein dithiol oxidoreductase (disulfide-forming)
MEGSHLPKSMIASFLAAALWLAAGLAHAEVIEGRDYTVLDPPQPTSSPGKIEVTVFFNYGCPPCSELQPLLRNWSQKLKLQPDVVIKRIATGFGQRAWTNLAKTYYALHETGDLDRLDDALFLAIHHDHQLLFDQESIMSWVAGHGVDMQKFSDIFSGFGVSHQLADAEKKVETYKIEHLPAIVVNGTYLVNGRSYEEVLRHTTELIVKARAHSRGSEASP